MVHPIGIEIATQRIQAIQARLAELGAESVPTTGTSPVDFDAVLDQQLQQSQSKRTSGKAIAPEIAAMIDQTANTHGVNPNLVKAVIQAESGFNPRAVSRAGAQGLMQLMPQTAKALGVTAAFNPQQNIQGGTKYLSNLLAKYQDNIPMALAAYNAGPGAVDRFGGIPPYRETKQYVQRVLHNLQQWEHQE